MGQKEHYNHGESKESEDRDQEAGIRRRGTGRARNQGAEDGKGKTGDRGQERQEKGLSIEILGPFPIPEQFCEFLIRHNINTFVGLSHPFFKTNDDQ